MPAGPIITTDVHRAAERLRAGGVVAMPTETVYGLAARIDLPDAIRRVFEMKARPLFDPLIVHLADPDQAGEVAADFPPLARRLADRFWPGPLTLVLPRRPEVAPLITAGLETVGVRVPARPAARALIRAAGAPLAAPSANRFGRTSPTTSRHVADEFPGVKILILDDGPCDVGVESTVVRVSEDGALVEVLRPGGVSREQIEGALAGWSSPVRVERAHSAASPGHTPHHYMPEAPLVIIGADAPAPTAERAGVIAGQIRAKSSDWAELLLAPDAHVAARTLYADLRRIASSGAGFIIVRRQPAQSGGLWEAVWDRLTRAASADLRSEP